MLICLWHYIILTLATSKEGNTVISSLLLALLIEKDTLNVQSNKQEWGHTTWYGADKF